MDIEMKQERHDIGEVLEKHTHKKISLYSNCYVKYLPVYRKIIRESYKLKKINIEFIIKKLFRALPELEGIENQNIIKSQFIKEWETWFLESAEVVALDGDEKKILNYLSRITICQNLLLSWFFYAYEYIGNSIQEKLRESDEAEEYIRIITVVRSETKDTLIQSEQKEEYYNEIEEVWAIISEHIPEKQKKNFRRLLIAAFKNQKYFDAKSLFDTYKIPYTPEFLTAIEFTLEENGFVSSNTGKEIIEGAQIRNNENIEKTESGNNEQNTNNFDTALSSLQAREGHYTFEEFVSILKMKWEIEDEQRLKSQFEALTQKSADGAHVKKQIIIKLLSNQWTIHKNGYQVLKLTYRQPHRIVLNTHTGKIENFLNHADYMSKYTPIWSK